MNKIIEAAEDPGVPVRLETVCRVRLGDLWRRGVLTGHYWRLYLNSAPGAGVLIGGKRRELLPERIYLLPPFCNLRTWCDNPEVCQLYIHFETPRFGGGPDFVCHELELTPELRLSAERLTVAADGDFRRLALNAAALVCAALAKLPEHLLVERGRDREIEHAVESMRGSLGSPLGVEALARSAGMNVNGFIKRFRRTTGSTPYRYLSDLRYACAARLLGDGDLPIDEIALEIGIADRFHFSREFKRRYGLPPAAYRAARRR